MVRVAVTVILTSPFSADEPEIEVVAKGEASTIVVFPLVGEVELSVTIYTSIERVWTTLTENHT